MGEGGATTTGDPIVITIARVMGCRGGQGEVGVREGKGDDRRGWGSDGIMMVLSSPHRCCEHGGVQARARARMGEGRATMVVIVIVAVAGARMCGQGCSEGRVRGGEGVPTRVLSQLLL